jgi:hypothetical protein
MLFALRQRQMRPLRTWRLEDAFSVSLSAMVTMTLCLCVHEYVSCVSVRAITPRGRGRELLSLLGMLPGGGRQQHAVMWGGYVLIRSVLTLTCEGPGGLSAARKKRPRFTCIVMYPNCKFICVERRSRTEATRRSERTSDPLCTRGMIAGGAIIYAFTRGIRLGSLVPVATCDPNSHPNSTV